MSNSDWKILLGFALPFILAPLLLVGSGYLFGIGLKLAGFCQ